MFSEQAPAATIAGILRFMTAGKFNGMWRKLVTRSFTNRFFSQEIVFSSQG
jgi:hypothetical protein